MTTIRLAPSATSPAIREFDYLVRCITVGDAAVGKTCLVQRFEKDLFLETCETIGVDLSIVYLEQGDKTIKMHLWDTAGQERFASITSAYFRSAHAVAFTYDVTNPDTLTHLKEKWIPDFQVYAEGRQVSMILLGNQSDRSYSQETVQEAQELASHYGMAHMLVSAKTGDGVSKAFCSLIEECLERQATDVKRSRPSPKPTTQAMVRSHFWDSWCSLV
eukprot:m.52228 g.52228  ORF g.52228 m.52228 type:complete len:218 (-) comp11291_c0_seq4:440-1093(-)